MTVIRRLALSTLLVCVVSCARVKPWQREDLARRSMIADQDTGERRFQQHHRASREGADGGTGDASGGCGCN
jgi:hypothetical protein